MSFLWILSKLPPNEQQFFFVRPSLLFFKNMPAACSNTDLRNGRDQMKFSPYVWGRDRSKQRNSQSLTGTEAELSARANWQRLTERSSPKTIWRFAPDLHLCNFFLDKLWGAAQEWLTHYWSFNFLHQQRSAWRGLWVVIFNISCKGSFLCFPGKGQLLSGPTV